MNISSFNKNVLKNNNEESALRSKIKNAIYVMEEYVSLGEKYPKKIYHPIFNKEEIEKAEIIIQALEGMTIISAKELLDKVQLFLMQQEFITKDS